MKKVLFVCHGNICRSPMAEFIMKDIVAKNGLSDDYRIESCATSMEEIGNDIYPPVKRILTEKGIPYCSRRARRMTPQDYWDFDLIIAMDHQNLHNLRPFVGNDPDRKVRLMLSYIGSDSGVTDPWYSGDFEKTFEDLTRSCLALFSSLERD